MRVLQRSIIGPTLFNIFINGFYVLMQNANIASFATLYRANKGIKTLIKAFEN